MRILIGIVISFAIGAGCRYFDVPVPSPPVVPGALLVIAMTIGYSAMGWRMDQQGKPASTAHLCGGPSGASAKSGSLSAADRRITTGKES